MSLLNCSLLIHTFNGYKHLWPGQAASFAEHWKQSEVKIYFGTDERQIEHPWHTGEMIYSGPGEWSDRLRRLATQIDTDYVMYCQEDHWLTAPPPDLYEMMQIVKENDVYRLQLSPIVHFYKLIPAGNIHYFDPSSKYLVSHQPSIWKKDFLLSVLHPNESPWKNEYEGTKRLNNDPSIKKKIAIYPHDWFAHKCIKGKVVES